MMVRADLGLAPWDVLHSGLTQHLPITIGQVLVGVSFVVLLLWIPLREKPGLGTISNALVVGFSADAILAVLSTPDALVARIALVVGGVVLCGLRDRGLHRRPARPRAARRADDRPARGERACRCGWCAPASRSPSC